MDSVTLAPNWYCEVIPDRVSEQKPGIYRWQIEGAGVYIGRYTRLL